MGIVSWTDARCDELTRLWAAGQTARMIAVVLGDVTRKAVIGKVNRLGLAGLERVGKAKQAPKIKILRERRASLRIVSANGNSNAMRVIRTVVFSPTADSGPEIEPRHIALVDLKQHHCRAPYGDNHVAPLTYCGHDKQEKSSWCPAHHALFHVPASESRRLRPAA